MANRSETVPITLSDLESGQIFRRIYLITFAPFDLERLYFGSITHMREQRISRGQPRPYCKRAVPQRSPILGFPSIYVYTL